MNEVNENFETPIMTAAANGTSEADLNLLAQVLLDSIIRGICCLTRCSGWCQRFDLR